MRNAQALGHGSLSQTAWKDHHHDADAGIRILASPSPGVAGGSQSRPPIQEREDPLSSLPDDLLRPPGRLRIGWEVELAESERHSEPHKEETRNGKAQSAFNPEHVSQLGRIGRFSSAAWR